MLVLLTHIPPRMKVGLGSGFPVLPFCTAAMKAQSRR
nr:MAG TPA: hypothetical protein [Caudoviricetes sp.]